MFPKRLRRPLPVLASLLIVLGACAPNAEPTEPTTSDVVEPRYDAANLMPSVQTRTTYSAGHRVDLGVSAVLVSGSTAYVRLAVEGIGGDTAVGYVGGADAPEEGDATSDGAAETTDNAGDEPALDAGADAGKGAGKEAGEGAGKDSDTQAEPLKWQDFLPTRTSTMAQGPGIPVRLLDLRGSRVYDSTTLDRPDGEVAAGDYAVVTFPAGELAAGDALALMVDPVGFFLDVPVVSGVEPPPAAKGVQEQLPTVERADFISDMVKLELAWDETESTVTEPTTTTITLDSDVLFAEDTSDLGADAEPMLASVAQRLAALPGGKITVTAHTDDTGEEDFNQELSQKRADVVLRELLGMADLAGFETKAVGKGESEPRVVGMSAQARLANRRVEIAATIASEGDSEAASEPKAPGAAQSTEIPEADGATEGTPAQPEELPIATGVVGDGVAGVDVVTPAEGGITAKEGRIRVRVPYVLRVDGWLLGEVEVEVLRGEPVLNSLLSVNPERVENLWGISLLLPDNLMILDGKSTIPAAAYRVAGAEVRSTLVPKSHSIKLAAGQTVVLPMVWPDTGAQTLTLTTERGARGTESAIEFRLTDVPVGGVTDE